MNGLDWQLDAACVDVEPELFYASEGRPGSRRQVIEAQKVCAVCPVVDLCAEWAFEINDQWAVLGGLSPRQRQKSRAPGPWRVDGPFWVDPPGVTPSELTVETRAGVSGKDRALVMPGTWETKDVDAAHIAAMDPPTTLALLDEADADRADNQALRLLVASFVSEVAALIERAEAAEAARDAAVADAANLRATIAALADSWRELSAGGEQYAAQLVDTLGGQR